MLVGEAYSNFLIEDNRVYRFDYAESLIKFLQPIDGKIQRDREDKQRMNYGWRKGIPAKAMKAIVNNKYWTVKKLTLARFEARVNFVDDVNTSFSTNNTTVFIAIFQSF